MSHRLKLLFTEKRDGQLRKAREDKGRLETEVEELEKKINRMSTMQKQVGNIFLIIFQSS